MKIVRGMAREFDWFCSYRPFQKLINECSVCGILEGMGWVSFVSFTY